MSHVRFLAENFFNPIQFPLHVYTSGQFADVFRIGASRRSPLASVDASAFSAVNLDCDRVREADTVIIDRGWEFAGRVTVGTSNAAGTIQDKAIDAVPPTEVVQGSSIYDPAHWILTEEGALVCHFPARASKHWRLEFQTGPTVLPNVYLGKSYSPTYPRLPFDEATRWNTFGTVRRGVPDNDTRTGQSATVSMMMRDEQEWDTARWTLRQLWGRGHPMWFIHAPNTERAWLSYNVDGSMAAPFSERPQGRTVEVNMEEYDPALP